MKLPFPTAILIAATACSTSCSSQYTTHPAPLDPTLVANFRRDTSTAQDVKKLLGAPTGYGALRLSGESQPRTTWFYEKSDTDIPPPGSTTASTYTVKQTVLFIFFKADRYDGYCWFSNAPSPAPPPPPLLTRRNQ